MGKTTDDRHRAITKEMLDEAFRRSSSNGGRNSREDLTGPVKYTQTKTQELALVDPAGCGQADCPARSAPVVTREQVQPPPTTVDRLKGLPLSLGTLVALILAVIFVLNFVEGRNEKAVETIKRVISNHNRADDAHQGFRRYVDKTQQETKAQLKDLKSSVNKRFDKLEGMIMQSAQRRRRR